PIELLSKGKTTTTGRAELWAAAGLVIAAAANAVAAAAERTTWISGRMMFLLNLHVGRAGGAAPFATPSDRDRHSFGGRRDPQPAAPCSDHGLAGRDRAIDLFVRAFGPVVKEQDFFHPGVESQRHCILVRRMSPTAMALVFRGRVGRIMYQYRRPAHELHQPISPIRRAAIGLVRGQLVVRDVDERPSDVMCVTSSGRPRRLGKAIAQRSAGVLNREGRDLVPVADVPLLGDLAEVDARAQLLEAHRKDDGRHLVAYHLIDASL